jgi:hypothetical protein
MPADPKQYNEPQTVLKDVPDKPEEVERKKKHDQRGETFLASMCAAM